MTHTHYLPAAGRHWMLPGYDLTHRLFGLRRVYDQVAATAQEGARVLEVGCGTGILTAKLARRAARVTGIDPDPRALARARRKTRRDPRVTFDEGFAQHLPYPDGSFDLVYSALMLHHVEEADKQAVLTEARRVLTPGGALHLVDFAGNHRPGHPHVHGNGDLRGQLERAGFADVREVARHSPRVGELAHLRGTA